MQEVEWARGVRHGPAFWRRGWIEPGVAPQASGVVGTGSPSASAGYRGRGGAARRVEAASAGSTWLPRGWGKEGVWALHPGLAGVLSPPSLGSWGSMGAVGREMLGGRSW